MAEYNTHGEENSILCRSFVHFCFYSFKKIADIPPLNLINKSIYLDITHSLTHHTGSVCPPFMPAED